MSAGAASMLRSFMFHAPGFHPLGMRRVAIAGWRRPHPMSATSVTEGILVVWVFSAVMLRGGGASSTPRPLGSSRAASGILDRPVEQGDDTEFGLKTRDENFVPAPTSSSRRRG